MASFARWHGLLELAWTSDAVVLAQRIRSATSTDEVLLDPAAPAPPSGWPPATPAVRCAPRRRHRTRGPPRTAPDHDDDEHSLELGAPTGADVAGHTGDDRAWRLAAAFLLSLRSPNARRAYARDIRDFYTWCDQIGGAPLQIRRVHVDRPGS